MHLPPGIKIFSVVLSSHTQQPCRSLYATDILAFTLEQQERIRFTSLKYQYCACSLNQLRFMTMSTVVVCAYCLQHSAPNKSRRVRNNTCAESLQFTTTPGVEKKNKSMKTTGQTALSGWKGLFSLNKQLPLGLVLTSLQITERQLRHSFVTSLVSHVSSVQSENTKATLLSQGTPWPACFLWVAHPGILNVLSLQ